MGVLSQFPKRGLITFFFEIMEIMGAFQRKFSSAPGFIQLENEEKRFINSPINGYVTLL
jgi:hypothetical protein